MGSGDEGRAQQKVLNQDAQFMYAKGHRSQTSVFDRRGVSADMISIYKENGALTLQRKMVY